MGRSRNVVDKEYLCKFRHVDVDGETCFGKSYLKNSDRERADLKIMLHIYRRSWTKTLSFKNFMDHLIPIGGADTDQRYVRVTYYQVLFEEETQLWTLKNMG